jgi:hypothetical protein
MKPVGTSGEVFRGSLGTTTWLKLRDTATSPTPTLAPIRMAVNRSGRGQARGSAPRFEGQHLQSTTFGTAQC